MKNKSKSVLLSWDELDIIVTALKNDREERGDDENNTMEELENDLRMVMNNQL